MQMLCRVFLLVIIVANYLSMVPAESATKHSGDKKRRDIVVVDTIVYVAKYLHLTAPWGIYIKDEGCFYVEKGAVLEIQGYFNAPRKQIFLGGGEIVLKNSLVDHVYPEWWGAKGNGKYDCSSAFIFAIRTGKKVFLSSGEYLLSSLHIIGQKAVFIEGSGMGITYLNFSNVQEGDAIFIGHDSINGGCKNVAIVNLSITDNRQKSPIRCLLNFEGGNIGYTPSRTIAKVELHNIKIEKHANRINGINVRLANISHIMVSNCYGVESDDINVLPKIGMVIEANESINTGVVTVENCLFKAVETALVIRGIRTNQLDSFNFIGNFFGNASSEFANSALLIDGNGGCISAVVFSGNHFEGRSKSFPVIQIVHGSFSGIFLGNHISGGTKEVMSPSGVAFNDIRLQGVSFVQNEFLRIHPEGVCISVSDNCSMGNNKALFEIRGVFKNITNPKTCVINNSELLVKMKDYIIVNE